jgi:hypothetical protein
LRNDIAADSPASGVTTSEPGQIVDPSDAMPVAELEIQPEWLAAQDHRRATPWLDFVTRCVLVVIGMLLLTVVVGSLVLVGLAFVAGYTAVLVGNAVLAHVPHNEHRVRPS